MSSVFPPPHTAGAGPAVEVPHGPAPGVRAREAPPRRAVFTAVITTAGIAGGVLFLRAGAVAVAAAAAEATHRERYEVKASRVVAQS